MVFSCADFFETVLPLSLHNELAGRAHRNVPHAQSDNRPAIFALELSWRLPWMEREMSDDRETDAFCCGVGSSESNRLGS